MYFKKLLKLAAVTSMLGAICLLAASCSKDMAGEKVIELQFVNWESTPEGMKFINRLIGEFENENPGVIIKNVVMPGRSYSDALLTRFAGNTAPDIFEINTEYISPFLEKGLLLNLSPYLADSTQLKEENFFQGGLVNFRYDGRRMRQGDIYGFPKDLTSAAVIYNKTLFDKQKLPYPHKRWTDRDYLDAAQKLTVRDASGRILQIGIERPLNSLDMVLNKEGRIWSDDYKKCLLDSKEGISAFQYVYDLQEVYRVALKNTDLRQGVAEGFGFKAGKAGMSLVYRYEMPDMVNGIGDRFEWGVASLPLVNGRRLQVFRGPSGWCISGKTMHPKEAFKFMEFLAGKRGQTETARLGWNIPADEKIAAGTIFLDNLNRPDTRQINGIFTAGLNDMYWGLVNPYMPRRLDAIIAAECDPGICKQRNGGKIDKQVRNMAGIVNKLIAGNSKL
ncbi:MAG: sugar ABC transporter substrate-binding protein [bacterium]|nr:sugar ABC transporter substrate-binding protein [bacterium]